MTKQDMIRSMERQYGHSLINTTQIAQFMGRSREFVRNEVVNGLDYIGTSHHKQYFVNDVADRIMRLRTA